MAKADGSVIIDTRIDTQGIVSGTKQIKSQMQGLSSTIGKIGGLIAGAFAVKQIVDFGKECLELGSDLQEVQNVVDVTFTTMSGKVDDFAKSAAKSFGLSETMAKRYVGTFGAMAKSFGFTEQEAYNMSTALTGLSGDVASFYNISQDEAYTKLKSVFTGETETLKDLGVVMTQAALDQYALANGYGKTTQAMTEQEKVALRFAFVQQQLNAASGDFIRTSDSWANQVRVMQLQLESLKATIGQGLINLFTPIIKGINLFLEKIATAANAFKELTELLTGKKSTASSPIQTAANNLSDLETGYSGAATDAGDLAQSTEDVADATDKAAKAAEGYLSPIDEINKYTTQNNSSGIGSGTTGGSGSGGGISGAVVDFGEAAQGDTVLDEMSDTIDKIIKKIKQLGKIFKKGFLDGLGDYKPALEDLQSDLKSIGKSLADIFTDADVQGAADNFVKNFVYALGQNIGALASIGLTYARNIVGGIEKYLSQNKNRIKKYLVDMFDAGAEIAALWGEFASALAEIISETFGSETAQQITGNIIGIFTEAGMLVSSLAAKLMADIANIIVTPFVENKDKIKQAIMGTLEAIEPFTSGLLTAVQTISDALTRLYDEHIGPFFDDIANGLTTIIGAILDGYNTYLLPILQGLGDKFQELMDGPFGEMIAKVEGFLGRLIDALNMLWNNVLVPMFTWLSEKFFPIISPAIETLGNLALETIEFIIKAIGNIADVLSGIIDFIVGVFSGDWELAWDGIKEIFSGIWELIVLILKTCWETIQELIFGAIKIIKNVISNAWEAIKKVTSTIWNGITDTLSKLWETLKNTASELFDRIKIKVNGIWDAIKEKAKNVWDRLSTWIPDKVENIKQAIIDKFQAAVDFVEDVFGKIVDFIKNPINEAIGLVNGAIGTINGAIGGVESAFSFSYDITNPITGTRHYGHFGLDLPRVPTIPYLASGAVIPPNKEFMAVLGDQKQGTNVEAPLETIKQALRDVNGESGSVGNIRIPIYINGRQILEAVVDEAQLKQMRSGKNPFALGGA